MTIRVGAPRWLAAVVLDVALVAGGVALVATPASAATAISGHQSVMTVSAERDSRDYRQGYRDGFRDGWNQAKEDCREMRRGYRHGRPGDYTRGYDDGFRRGFALGFREYCR